MLKKFYIVLLIVILISFIGCTNSDPTTDVNKNDNKIEDNQETTTEIDENTSKDGENSTVYSIVGANYLLGGSINGKWLSVDEIKGFIKGGEKYNIYSLTKIEGQCIGEEPIICEGPGEWIDVPIKDIDKYELEFGIIEKESYKTNFSEKLYVTAEVDAMPRVPQIQDNTNSIYKSVIEDILVSKGIKDADANIKQILRIDLEGDGVEEVLITASNFELPLFYSVDKGSYSFVVLRKIIDGEVKNIILEGYFYKQEEASDFVLSYAYYIPWILDANGDGRMEIFIEGRYYEGDWINVYEIKNNEVELVISFGIGA